MVYLHAGVCANVQRHEACTWGLNYVNERHSYADCGWTVAAGCRAWLTATLQEMGLKSSMSGTCGVTKVGEHGLDHVPKNEGQR